MINPRQIHKINKNVRLNMGKIVSKVASGGGEIKQHAPLLKRH